MCGELDKGRELAASALSAPAPAEVPIWRASIMSELDPFFARYAERYMASDVDAISAMYEAPMLALREGRAIRLADRTAVREHLTEVMAAYARSGAAQADVVALDVVPLGKSSVFATVLWHVRDAGGGS